ncbi:Protein of unknown function [Gryllus bimaculatus]|nr:Protein of unknown function [Gryllus bimaculatus]
MSNAQKKVFMTQTDDDVKPSKADYRNILYLIKPLLQQQYLFSLLHPNVDALCDVEMPISCVRLKELVPPRQEGQGANRDSKAGEQLLPN